MNLNRGLFFNINFMAIILIILLMNFQILLINFYL